MNKTPVGLVDRERLETAAQWWARLQEPEAPPEEVSEWLEWIEAESQNREAYRRIQELSLRLQATREVRTKRRHPLWNTRMSALAAGIAVLIVGTLFLWGPFSSSEKPSLLLSTPVAALEQAPLPDGSKVVLGGATSVEASYTQQSRKIRLKDGEAYFEVQHEKSMRPFIVDAGAVSVRALGTAFNVRKTGDRVTITVTEGKVQVERTQASPSSSRDGRKAGARAITASAGEQATYDPEADHIRLMTVDARHAVTWWDRQLEFVDEPLDAVIANVNRYASRHIEIRDVDLHSHFYTGTFHPDSMDEWLVAIERSFPVAIRTDSEGVVIEPRK